MPSPFPGMDPYLESQPFWSNLHSSLIVVLQTQLKRKLPSTYSVWADVYVWLHEPDAETRRGKPDDFITSTRVQGESPVATLSAPARSILPAIRRTGNKYLKIKEVRSDRVITVIEFLSPANKTPGEDHDSYLAKRNEYLATGANLVEIDLLRAGERMPMGRPKPPRADYYVLVCRAVDFPRTAIWPISMCDPLPEISIPLKPEDGFIPFPLQPCFDAAYDAGPYDREVDYTKPPLVKLSKSSNAWAKSLLATATKKGSV